MSDFLSQLNKNIYGDPFKPTESKRPKPAKPSSAQKKVSKIVSNVSAKPVQQVVQQSLNADQAKRGGKSRAQIATETPGQWENAVARGRKILGTKKDSSEDKTLKQLLWTVINEKGDGKPVNEAEVIKIYKLMQGAKRGDKLSQKEIKDRVDSHLAQREARETFNPSQLPFQGWEEAQRTQGPVKLTQDFGKYKKGQVIGFDEANVIVTLLSGRNTPVKPYDENQQAVDARGQMNGFAGLSIADQEKQIADARGELGNIASRVISPLTMGQRTPLTDFAGGVVADTAFAPLKLGQAIADERMSPIDRVLLGAEALSDLVPAFGDLLVKPLLKGAGAVSKELGILMKAIKSGRAVTAEGFVAIEKAARAAGVENSFALAKQVREAEATGKLPQIQEAISKFEPKADPNYQGGEAPDLVGMAQNKPRTEGLLQETPAQNAVETPTQSPQKEPWQMTREEIASQDPIYQEYLELGFEDLTNYYLRQVDDARYTSMLDALQRGDDVPQSLIDEFINLGEGAGERAARKNTVLGRQRLAREGKTADEINAMDLKYVQDAQSIIKGSEKPSIQSRGYEPFDRLPLHELTLKEVGRGAHPAVEAVPHSGYTQSLQDRLQALADRASAAFQKSGKDSSAYRVADDAYEKARKLYELKRGEEIDQAHFNAIEQALKEGKPVPAEVLADYPDLAKRYGNVTEVASSKTDLPTGQKEPWQTTVSSHIENSKQRINELFNAGRGTKTPAKPVPEPKGNSKNNISFVFQRLGISGKHKVEVKRVVSDSNVIGYSIRPANLGYDDANNAANALFDEFQLKTGISPFVRGSNSVGGQHDLVTPDFIKWIGGDHRADLSDIIVSIPGGGVVTDKQAMVTATKVVENEHRDVVEQALKEGKPVPAEVLADYPDLANRYGNVTKVASSKTSLSTGQIDNATPQPTGNTGELPNTPVPKGTNNARMIEDIQNTNLIPVETKRVVTNSPSPKIAVPKELEGVIDTPTLSSAVEAARARKAARAASKGDNVSLSSGFDPDIIADVIDDVIIFVGEKAVPIEKAIRNLIKERGLGDDAFDEINNGVRKELGIDKRKPPEAPQIKPQVAKTVVPDTLGPGAQRVNKDTINKYRQALNLDMTKPGSRGWDKDIEKAVNEGFVDNAVDTAKKLKEAPRPMATHEQFAAGIKLDELNDDLIKAEQSVADAVESGDLDSIVKAKEARQAITDDIDVLTLTLNKNGGTDVARSLASRRALINAKLQNPRAYAVSTLGRKLTEVEEEAVKGFEKGINDAKDALKQAETGVAPRADVAKRLNTRQPRKIEKLVSKAEQEYNAAKARASQAAKAMQGKGRRGGAVNPYLFDVAYHGAKLQILKGVRALDDIIKFIKQDAPDITDEDLMNAIDSAEKDLRQPAKSVTKPNLATLRGEIKTALDSANGVEQINYFNDLLDDLDALAKEPAAKTGAEAIELADKAATIKRKLATGQSYGRDIMARGDNAIQDKELIKARGRVKREEAKLKAWANAQVEKERRETLNAGRKAWDFVKGGIMNSRQLLTGPDTSFGLRQGATAILQWHFKEGGQMIWDGLKSFVSEGQFNVTDSFVRGMKRYDEAIGAGLDLTDFVAGKTEEDILGGWIQQKWTKANPYRSSNRAYTAAANTVRLRLYEKLADGIEGAGKSMTTDEAEALTNFINVMTGRSNALSGEKAGKILNGIAFAPKYAMSRIEYLAGSPLWKAMKAGKDAGDMRVATAIAKEYMKFYGSITALGVGLQIGADRGWWEAELDPRSTNFMKVGVRNKSGSTTWYDLTGGLGSYFVGMYRTGAALTRFVQGSVLNTKDPLKPIKNQSGEYTDNYGMAAGGFITGKTSPLLKTTITALSNFDRKTGKTKDFGKVKGPAELGAGLVVPISGQTVMEGKSKEQQLENLEAFRNYAFEFFGGGNQTVDIKESEAAAGRARALRKKLARNPSK